MKNYSFNSYFQHISMWFYSNFEWEQSLDGEFKYASNEYPLKMLFVDPIPQKMRNT